MVFQDTRDFRLYRTDYLFRCLLGRSPGDYSDPDAVWLSIDAQSGVGREEKGTYKFVYPGFRKPPRLYGSGKNNFAWEVAAKLRENLLFPHALQFPRRTGECQKGLPPFLYPPPRSGATRVRNGVCGGDEHCLLDVLSWHLPTQAFEDSPDPLLKVRINTHFLPYSLGNSFAGDIILRRAKPTHRNNQINALQ